MALKSKIVTQKPREKSGSTSASRFDYQKDWSLCKLIESHISGKDYVAIFDYHDDLIIMDSESNPKSVDFFQIKGKKNGNWTTANLLTSAKAKDGSPLLSILGKLYDCKSKFELETTSLNFVSNARFNVQLTDKSSSLSKDTICIIELSDDEKNEIKAKIKKEHSLSTDPVFEDISFLRVVDLSLDDSSTHAKGKVDTFINDLFPGKKFNSASVYRMLYDEVKRRSNYTKDILNYNDLLLNKAIAKSEFDKIIKATGIEKDYAELWKRIEGVLYSDGLPFSDLKRLKQNWDKLEIERMNPTNSILFNLIKQSKDLISKEESAKGFDKLKLFECVTKVSSQMKISKNESLSYDDNFIQAIILAEIYE